MFLLIPDKSTDPVMYQMRAENIKENQEPVLTQRNEDQAVFDQSLIQGNSFAPICSTENAKIRTFADLMDDYDQARPESQSITGKEIVEYVVQKGDSYSSIADRYGISTQTIYWANGITSKTRIKEGQSLILLPVDGIIYFVKKGDSLDKIAKTYKTEKNKIIAFNELDEADSLYPGDALILPDAQMPYKAPASSVSAQPQYSDSVVPDGYFICPTPRVAGACRKTQGLHWPNAVDLAPGTGSCGQPVYASASGKVYKVMFSGYNGGYGSYIKILHPSGLTSLYAHMGKINVTLGQEVSTGEIIGLIGNTGRTIGITGCHVHFEIGSLEGSPPRNPFR